jgi:predicted GIY-YIG superfamily endonuclease
VIGKRRLRYRSFKSRREAEQVAKEMRSDEHRDALLGLVGEPVDLPDDPAWVYMLLDDDGVIVYVGCTRNLDGRYHDHRENHVEFTRMVFYPHPLDRMNALRAESALVAKHRPRLNGLLHGNTLETDRYVPRAWSKPELIPE